MHYEFSSFVALWRCWLCSCVTLFIVSYLVFTSQLNDKKRSFLPNVDANQRQPRFYFLLNDEIDSTIPDLAKITMIDK